MLRVSLIGLFIAIFFILGIPDTSLTDDKPIKIGVLAVRGPEQCRKDWSPTAEYLTNTIPGKNFVIVPLGYNQVYISVEKGEVDFILTNSSFYVELERWYGINRIATLKNECASGVRTTYGGVIFWRAT